MSKTTTVGFLGGTGIEGKGLALRLARVGVPVSIGSRSRERAREVSRELNSQLGRELIGAAENREMIGASEIVILTIPFEQAPAAIDAYRDCFRPATILVDATVPVKFLSGQVRLIELPEGSSSESLAKRLPPGIPLVAAFKTIPAHVLADLRAALECDVFVCSDSAAAKTKIMELIRLVPDLRPVDVGGLEAAGTLERMSALAIGINRRYRINSARFRVVGL